MKFKYIGPHDAVEVPGLGTVEHGHQVEVEGADAESLSKQTDWQRVDKPKPRKKAAANVAAPTPPPAKAVTTSTED